MKTATAINIQKEIKNMMKEKFQIILFENTLALPKKDYFFGMNIGLNAKQLVYLVHFIEDRFAIRFSPEDMDNPAFYTLSGMVNIVAEKLI